MAISLLPQDWLAEQLAAAGQVTPVKDPRNPPPPINPDTQDPGSDTDGRSDTEQTSGSPRKECLARGDQWNVIDKVCEPSFANLRKRCEASGKIWAVRPGGVNHECLTQEELDAPQETSTGVGVAGEGSEHVPPEFHPPPKPPPIPPDKPTPTGSDLAGEIRAQLPTFDPRIGQPEPFRPPSVADVLADPRYRMAERELDEQMRAQAAATGTRGAPSLAARSRAKQSLLGNMMGQLYGQGLQSWQAGLQHGQDTHNRFAAQHNRATVPLQMGYSHALGLAGHGLGQQQLGLGHQQLAWQREQQQKLFNQQRWLTGQNNAMSLYMAMLGMRAPGLEQRT